MDPAVGQTYTSCDYKTCAPVDGSIVAVDDQSVTMLVGRKRQKMSRNNFPTERRFWRGTRTWRLISSRAA